ncbi:Serine/threonine-protein kinase haspin [Clydaea vesicula]|uniref:non-specific serine/threonine protein kinase n=1 Tax=Clydaea vesicula TaxID=447962 RepID=A0AAD5Y499_9FUNG|nr:Serine/threonine-protein kinase haspin [Clydaea vesicula]
MRKTYGKSVRKKLITSFQLPNRCNQLNSIKEVEKFVEFLNLEKTKIEKIIYIQKTFKNNKLARDERKIFLNKIEKIKTIQAFIKKFLHQRNFKKIKFSVKTIQYYYRSHLIKLKYKKTRHSIIFIQQFWRSYTIQKKIKYHNVVTDDCSVIKIELRKNNDLMDFDNLWCEGTVENHFKEIDAEDGFLTSVSSKINSRCEIDLLTLVTGSDNYVECETISEKVQIFETPENFEEDFFSETSQNSSFEKRTTGCNTADFLSPLDLDFGKENSSEIKDIDAVLNVSLESDLIFKLNFNEEDSKPAKTVDNNVDAKLPSDMKRNCALVLNDSSVRFNSNSEQSTPNYSTIEEKKNHMDIELTAFNFSPTTQFLKSKNSLTGLFESESLIENKLARLEGKKSKNLLVSDERRNSSAKEVFCKEKVQKKVLKNSNKFVKQGGVTFYDFREYKYPQSELLDENIKNFKNLTLDSKENVPMAVTQKETGTKETIEYAHLRNHLNLNNLCTTSTVGNFSKYFDNSRFSSIVKIGEATSSEVFLVTDKEKKKSVIKILPFDGAMEVNGYRQPNINEVYQELVITSVTGNHLFKKFGFINFVKLHKSLIVKGKYPKKLLQEWDKYDVKHTSENDRPDYFKSTQKFILFEMEFGGEDLEEFSFFRGINEFKSFFFQTCFSLSLAEHELKFEHRDLHWGNILIEKTSEDYLTYKIPIFNCNNKSKKPTFKSLKLKTYGIKVRIIDFNLSRLETGSNLYKMDLDDPDLYNQDIESKTDIQFQCYRDQLTLTKGKWGNFFPQTNLIWLNYLLTKCWEFKFKKNLKKKFALEFNSFHKKFSIEKLLHTSLKDENFFFKSSIDVCKDEFFYDIFVTDDMLRDEGEDSMDLDNNNAKDNNEKFFSHLILSSN